MRNKIERIDSDNGKFKDGDPLSGEYGTIVKAKWLNDVQEGLLTNQGEILTVLREAGIEVNEADETQLWQALQVLSGQVDSIAALREFEPRRDRQLAYVKGYHAGNHKGGGRFVSDLADNQTDDNGGTVIVSEGGKRWKRVENNLSLYDFGYSSPENAVAALERAERANLGVIIDCCGLTIDFANKYPTANKYTNGKFIINGTEVVAQYNQPRTGIGRFISGSGAAEKLRSNEWTGADIVAIGEGAMAKMEKCVSGIAIGQRAQGTTLISRDNIAIGADTSSASRNGVVLSRQKEWHKKCCNRWRCWAWYHNRLRECGDWSDCWAKLRGRRA